MVEGALTPVMIAEVEEMRVEAKRATEVVVKRILMYEVGENCC